MWKRSANSDSVKPAEVDKTISATHVFVRKNFEEVPSYDEEGNETGTHWEYDETQVPREDWDTFETAINAEQVGNDNSADIQYIAMMADIDLDD